MIGKIYRYAWGPRWPNVAPVIDRLSRKGHLCTVLAVGKMNSALVQFDGYPRAENQYVVSRNALRKP